MLQDAMQELVQSIIRSQQERREFLARNRRETQRMLETASRNRQNLAREADRNASILIDSLQAANRSNQRSVATKLREIRNQRQSQATQLRMVRSEGVARNQRDVSRALQENSFIRARGSRLRKRETAKTLREIKSEVQQIRKASKALTTKVRNDLLASRRNWARLRSASGM